MTTQITHFLSQTQLVRLSWTLSWTRLRLSIKSSLRSAMRLQACVCSGPVLPVMWTGTTLLWRTAAPDSPARPESWALLPPSLVSAHWSLVHGTQSVWWLQLGTRVLHLSTPLPLQVRPAHLQTTCGPFYIDLTLIHVDLLTSVLNLCKVVPPADTHFACLAAPSLVRGLQVTSLSSDSLHVTWQAGPGRTEQFKVLLTDLDGVLLKNVTLQNTVTSTWLDGLQPGTLYTITVVTEAVGLQSSASKQAVTGIMGHFENQNLPVCF